jgi:hypothetical protein
VTANECAEKAFFCGLDGGLIDKIILRLIFSKAKNASDFLENF